MVIYLIAMLLIGLYSFKQTDEYEDYMLAGRNLHPFPAALSAGASDMSGWLLMGLPGALYMSGFSELWMAIGLLVGAAVAVPEGRRDAVGLAERRDVDAAA